MKYLFPLILFVSLVSCSSENIWDNRSPNSNNFNIYFVKPGDEYMYREDVELDLLQLEETPWVKSSEIEFYDWSAQTFYLSKEVEKSDYSARNFVVTSGERRLFFGVFWPMYMSSLPMIPFIMPEDDWWNPKDVIRFNSIGYISVESLNDNEEFKSELIQEGLFCAGINVDITKLKKINSSTLEYTFIVTNLESQKIYVPDPSKMGAAHFHYYTNGVSLQQDNNSFWPHDFETKESEKFSSKWYYKLKPGESITRTVKMGGYTNLPSGKVKAKFQFPGAHHLSAGEWKKPDGRIWIGSFATEEEITIQ